MRARTCAYQGLRNVGKILRTEWMIPDYDWNGGHPLIFHRNRNLQKLPELHFPEKFVRAMKLAKVEFS